MSEASFSPADFRGFIEQAGEMPLIGGQAVAWWCEHYREEIGAEESITSRDIDFWAGRSEMEEFARRAGLKLNYPHRYAMTVLSGNAEVSIDGVRTNIEFLHTVPGVDAEMESATVVQSWDGASVRILDPVSLIASKLHALRNFDQSERQDLRHLAVSVKTARAFIAEVLAHSVRQCLWYAERVITQALQRRNHKIVEAHELSLLEAIPVNVFAEKDSEKLETFLSVRWPQVLEKHDRLNED